MIRTYNQGNLDATYDMLDDLAKAQVSREKLNKQLDKLSQLIGKVESAS